MSGNTMTRRRLLAVAPALLAVACSAKEAPLPAPTPSADRDAAVRRQVSADIRRLLASYDATIGRHPELTDELLPFVIEHGVHLRALARAAPAASTQRGSIGAPSAPISAAPDPVPATTRAARAALAAAEGAGAARRVDQLLDTAPSLARLLAAIGASEAAHAALLSRTT